nr:VTT domain-containing protein [uncultured Desulfobacter sp.]
MKKLLLIILIAGLIAASFRFGLADYFSLEGIKHSQGRIQAFYHENPALAIAVFTGIYIPSVAFNLPWALVLGLAAGAFFGTFTGTVVVSFASSIGALLACIISRYLLADWVKKKFKDKLDRVNQGFAREGAFYLFALRLIPLFPFFAVNMVMGVTAIRLTTFYWVSQLGMLPATVVFVNAGSQISKIDSLSGILSGKLMISLALVGILPLVAKRFISLLRKKKSVTSQFDSPIAGVPFGLSDDLSPVTADILEKCTNCGACQVQCAFLTRYGTPKEILTTLDPAKQHILSFECSLCGLCRAVCPENIDPGEAFLHLRRVAVANEQVDLSTYSTILGYEKKGTSKLFSCYALPQNCDTIFFPGCTLSGTRPKTTWALFETLRAQTPNLGIVLDCCTKPSHDLGREHYFQRMFEEMLNFLQARGIKRIWLACPNCYKVFTTYAPNMSVESVYEVLAYSNPPCTFSDESTSFKAAPMVVHDPCPLRDQPQVHESVRALLAGMDLSIEKMAFEKKKTLCCGEGGTVGFIDPELARTWIEKRKKTAGNRSIVTYCAGCAGFLNRAAPTVHLLDLLFFPGQAASGHLRTAKAPLTYFHRLALKRKIKKTLPKAFFRERNYRPIQ